MNNQAERDLYPAKVKIKLAGIFRDESGANKYVRIQSFISNTKQYQFDVFSQLTAAFKTRKY